MSAFQLVPWEEDRVRFEKDFKPSIAKLLKQTLPEFKLVRGDFEAATSPDGCRMVSIRLVISDQLAGLALEEKS